MLSAKTQKSKNLVRNADKQTLQFFCKSKPSVFEKTWFVGWRKGSFKDFEPVLLWMFKESVAVDIVHMHNAEHRSKIGKTTNAPDAPLHDYEQQISDERHTYLYLDGIGTLTVEISQQEGLLELLEEFMRSFS